MENVEDEEEGEEEGEEKEEKKEEKEEKKEARKIKIMMNSKLAGMLEEAGLKPAIRAGRNSFSNCRDPNFFV